MHITRKGEYSSGPLSAQVTHPFASLWIRKQLLNRRLAVLLTDSKRAYDNLERLQTQVMQTEKLASIGRLVSGAAHELNNPLTAILGYSELLGENLDLGPEQASMARKIGQQALELDFLSNALGRGRGPSGKR